MKIHTTNSATHNTTFHIISVLVFKLVCLSFQTGNMCKYSISEIPTSSSSTNETHTLQKVLINEGTAFLIFKEATCSKTFRRTSTAG